MVRHSAPLHMGRTKQHRICVCPLEAVALLYVIPFMIYADVRNSNHIPPGRQDDQILDTKPPRPQNGRPLQQPRRPRRPHVWRAVALLAATAARFCPRSSSAAVVKARPAAKARQV